jgi:hypothetical protein
MFTQKFLVLSPASTALPKTTVDDTAPLFVDANSPGTIANPIRGSQDSSVILCSAPITDIEARQPRAPLANGFLRVGFDGVATNATK